MLRAFCIAGVAAAVALSRPTVAADVPVCPAFTELFLVVILRTFRDLAVGPVVVWATGIATVTALFLVARLLLTLRVSLVPTAAVTIAVATTPLLWPTLGAPSAAGFAIWAAVWLVVRDRHLRVWLLAAAALVAATLAGVAASGSQWTQCAGPATLSSAAFGAAPLPIALALLGTWMSTAQPRAHLAWMAAVAGGLILAGATTPLVLGFWILCGLGLQDTTGHLRSGGALLAVAVAGYALLGLPAVPENSGPRMSNQLALSRNAFLDRVSPLPDDAALVREDAITDLLERALPSRVRDRRVLGVVHPVDHEVTAQLERSRVFALPKGSHALAGLGFHADVIPHNQNTDLAEIRAGSPCSTGLTTTWGHYPAVAVSDTFAFVADEANSRGPVYVYLRSAAPLMPATVDWPAGTTRGFHVRTFDLTSAEAPDARLTLDMASYGAEGERAA